MLNYQDWKKKNKKLREKADITIDINNCFRMFYYRNNLNIFQWIMIYYKYIKM